VKFTRRREHRSVAVGDGPRYGAILWDVAADLNDAIRLVKGVADPMDAIRLVAASCQDGQRWAVVDLQRMTVVAEGNPPPSS
jgi:hypothetical protein